MFSNAGDGWSDDGLRMIPARLRKICTGVANTPNGIPHQPSNTENKVSWILPLFPQRLQEIFGRDDHDVR
jgi:hypothetical protein